ncbi:hypothetical protein KCH_47110 [Kitasatospora cheerisanensis KCTC 2395]|uniref:Uncharacterized protein n=1 Tax=Kitasatospora cheerisanensis KCTC 2395 TaxID=1348663 RepID=A0A066YTD5_9ACTN|nr:hypothetical protein KCH_47110 [Kitasatospora cheerisanensis KCTC 2395]
MRVDRHQPQLLAQRLGSLPGTGMSASSGRLPRRLWRGRAPPIVTDWRARPFPRTAERSSAKGPSRTMDQSPTPQTPLAPRPAATAGPTTGRPTAGCGSPARCAACCWWG